MSWTRGAGTALAACVLLLTGTAGCGSGDEKGPGAGASPTSAGRLLGDTDEDGRRYREAAAGHAPEVGIEVKPNADDSWDVRLTVRDFRFSPAGTEPAAVAGRGVARLFVDGDLITALRGPRHRLVAGLVPRGTHHVTARLYADDGTVWAVDGEPVESTADITASDAGPTGATQPTLREDAAGPAGGPPLTGGHGSPGRGGEAS
ncbi:hypothetical protein [Streptomyces sp. SID5910]|uniref:hypothetical protein n=1 Tax=Streptomyces sp. SID5910 TaxID=2690312 RepID=UPI00137172CE|nr:hypothetical protein [Streptomyces sp. SID5910]MYR42642.1 hypothetical protein [Streptomyces sp. SID5910]